MSMIDDSLSRFKLKITVLVQAIGYSLNSFRCLTKGQIPKYEILQLSHRLEKGLLNVSPKPLWGWDKAERLISLIKVNDDEFSNQTGRGVLLAYIKAKKKGDNLTEKERAIIFERQNLEILKGGASGGVMSLRKEDVTIIQKEVVEHFFNTRHSCRDYQDILVTEEDIKAAIALAMRCPSACNRQVTKCYVLQSCDLQTIILTTNIRAFDVGEFNDWFVSPSIFAGYLSLSLHLYGIGSCVYRKQLYGHHVYNENIKKRCGIPDDEIIVLELHFGYYKNQFNVAFSNRHSEDDIITFVRA